MGYRLMKDLKEYLEDQVELAEKIAREKHEGQTRKIGEDKGKPYIIHPERMANTFEEAVLKAASWLHDVVEDTDTTFEDLLELGVAKEIVNVLRYVTKKKGEPYKDFIFRILYNTWAMKIKIADINDNLKSCPEGHMKEKYRLALWILEYRLSRPL